MQSRIEPECHICHKTSSSVLLVGFKMQRRSVGPCVLCRRLICELEVVRYSAGNEKLKVIGCKSCAVIPATAGHRKKSKAAKHMKSSHRRLLP